MAATYGISTLSVIPGRAEPADAAEQVTQLLFGESYEVRETRKKWMRIRCGTDGYDCWIDIKQHTPIDEKYFDRLSKTKFSPCSLEMAGLAIRQSDGQITPILLGSTLPFFKDGQFKIGKEIYQFEGHVQEKAEKKNSNLLIQNAMMFLQTPYLWGGRHPFGVDCSGLVQVCYRTIGVMLPRDAYQQAEWGQSLSFIEESQPGDLAFFDNDDGRIIHVGILLEDNYIIHASGHVRIDRIDHQGIYNNTQKDYSHRLRIIKRILDR
jgi:hypothetical protein